MNVGSQALVIQLQSSLARKVRSFISDNSAYADLSEFVAVAIENQLSLEASHGGRLVSRGRAIGAGAEVDSSPAASVVESLRHSELQPPVMEASAVQSALYSLTNRLFPVKVAARVLGNLSLDNVSLELFHRSAGVAARAVGLRLRGEDAAEERKGLDRRWIALPVGDDEHAALGRFVNHFTIVVGTGGLPNGPLAQLGLASIDAAGAPLLTEIGRALAQCENPLLDGGEADLLSDDERRILVSAIRGNAPELAAVKEFIAVVRDRDGRQPDVDAGIGQSHPTWSESQAIAQRAAMIGRLHDLGLASVEGRGPRTLIHLAETIDEQWEE